MPFHQQLLYNAMELITGDAMLITGRFVHCVGKFVGFQTNVVQMRS
jgi:hypothetical protein